MFHHNPPCVTHQHVELSYASTSKERLLEETSQYTPPCMAHQHVALSYTSNRDSARTDVPPYSSMSIVLQCIAPTCGVELHLLNRDRYKRGSIIILCVAYQHVGSSYTSKGEAAISNVRSYSSIVAHQHRGFSYTF